MCSTTKNRSFGKLFRRCLRRDHAPAARRRKNRVGAAAVEMALVSPFVFFLIFSCFEFARMMMVKQTMDNAVREGSRKASLASTLTSSSADAKVREFLNAVIDNPSNTSEVRITANPTFNDGLATGTPITISVEVDCADVSWLPPVFFAGAKIRSTCYGHRE